MAEKVFVKPGRAADGSALVVRDPKTMDPIPEEGAMVELDRLTRRRLADRDLVRADAAKAAPATRSTRVPEEKG